jgi:hypothetical protein
MLKFDSISFKVKCCGICLYLYYFTFIGHYTQIVWKKSTQIGVGKAGGIVVLNYSPPGNYRGSYTANVPCPLA